MAVVLHVAAALCVLLTLDLSGWRTMAVKTMLLDSNEWSVVNGNGSLRFPATVPGGIYSDIQNAKHFDTDLFFGYNDLIHRWVAYENWTFGRIFQVSEDFSSKRYVQLVLHGADTVGEVWVNNKKIGNVDNMFVRHAFPVGIALRPGKNEISVNFTSAPIEGKRRFETYGKKHGYFVLPKCVPPRYNGECHINHLRKMQASFSWDWGPAFPSQGLWKSVALEAFNSAILRDVMAQFIEPKTKGGEASLQVEAFLEAGPGAEPLNGTLSAELLLAQEPAKAVANITLNPDARGHCMAKITIDGFEEPPRWWPNGEGEQPLLHLVVTFVSADGLEKSSVERRVAYRTIELVQEPIHSSAINPQRHKSHNTKFDPEEGLTFYFRVNGRPLFAKGSNWIPSHVLPELGADPDRVHFLLQSARDAHMNMLRVWGGGVYESDYFYDLADEMGILIWQDFMFACNMYPANRKYLASVNEEITQQVRRLQTHGSVALWAANNENEAALVQNWYGTSVDNSQYTRDYVLLYANTIRKTVMNMDPTRPFLVSSPSNGLKTDESGFISTNPASEHYGDVHHYNYFSDGCNPDTYPIPRFASEYGFQSLPSLATLRTVATTDRDLAAGSRWARLREHLDEGYLKMADLIGLQMHLPANWSLPENFPTFIYLTQMSQALMIQTQTEHYRRLRSQVFSDNRGLCMGALYWQLNDVWQAPTWSSIDFEGRWKPLHYFAEQFFAPQMASAYLNTAQVLHVYAINDRPDPVMSVVLQGSAGRWEDTWEDGLRKPTRSWRNLTSRFVLKAAGSQPLISANIFTFMDDMPGCRTTPEYCFLLLRLVALPDEQVLGPVRIVYPVPLKNLHGLSIPRITVEFVSEPNTNGALEVVLQSDRPAPLVWLESGTLSGRFSENAFLMSEPRRTVLFFPDDTTPTPSAAELRKAITISSLAHPEPNVGYDFTRKVFKRSPTLEEWILSFFSILM